MSLLSLPHRRFLQDLFPKTDCLLTPEEMVVFEADASRLEGTPLAVVRPETEEQIIELMRWAHKERIPLYPRARATNVVGLCVPQKPGIVVSTLKMNSILEVDSDDFIARVQPGVITGDLQKRVEQEKLFYPPDPASLGISTIGGNVATCAGGMRALKYGVTREWVLGCKAVLPGGKTITCGGRNHKNVVGLDLLRLLTGSEGTLAFMTEITLKLIPKPESTASILAGFANLEEALHAIKVMFKAGMLPAALEFMGPEVLTALQDAGAVPWPSTVTASLLLRFDGSHQGLEADLEKAGAIFKACNVLWSTTGIGKEEEEPLWDVRRSINPASFKVAPDKYSDDVTVPRGKLLEAVTGIRQIANKHSLTILTFGHVGDGNIHVNIMHDASDHDELARAKRAKKEISNFILSLRGTLSGEHGVGLVKAPYVHLQLSETERSLMKQIKHIFDPHSIMNPGKAF
ncbi:FAD-binding oxidoreductase [Halodesulfovibrio marinisediminis]|uniref:Glycolate oxidase n=1 Tax=Halodesulfovibrio marinisediminis DSM 17456 TaxID=1121457 RepID=A0A1N6HDU6_9BACT|nr:FAD-linked oxidase C-terminal domain-containing protein [Halodesulfovibrio marinisediminis]SIO18014.1 glycolate oxidase [Halodesulfovibrio marinisediminis DSM 17456]